jgi:hypothetical protein
MTPPTSNRPTTVAQRVWRHQSRLRVLRLLGGQCAFLGDDCGGRREIAHRFPALRPIRDGKQERRRWDDLLREVRADPFAFALLCHEHHVRMDCATFEVEYHGAES